jgi:hypothetical protein
MLVRSTQNHLATLIAASMIIMGVSTTAWAETHNAVSCDQEGSTLSGACDNGSDFSLVCTDGNDPIDCDLSEETAWDICDDQCNSANGGPRPDERERGDVRIDHEDARTRAVTTLRKQPITKKSRVSTILGRPGVRTVTPALQSRDTDRENTVIIGRTRSGSLSISRTQGRDDAEIITWTYRERGASLVLRCNNEQDTCQVLENGRRTNRASISPRGVRMAQQANEIMQLSDWQDDVPTDWLDGLCYAAGIASGFWPIGTAVAGPTAIGCIVMYSLEE